MFLVLTDDSKCRLSFKAATKPWELFADASVALKDETGQRETVKSLIRHLVPWGGGGHVDLLSACEMLSALRNVTPRSPLQASVVFMSHAEAFWLRDH